MSAKDSGWLIGKEEPEIVGSKLPSNLQVLKCFLYHYKTSKKSISEAGNCVADKIMLFWDAAGIRTKNKQHVSEKVKKLFGEFRKRRDTSLYRVAGKKEHEHLKKFTEQLDNLFDIAHAAALDELTGADKKWLLAQREPGRTGNFTKELSSAVLKKERSLKNEMPGGTENLKEEIISIASDDDDNASRYEKAMEKRPATMPRMNFIPSVMTAV